MQSVEPKPGPELERRVPGPSFPFRPRRHLRRDRGTRVARFRDGLAVAMVVVVLPCLMIPALIVLAPSVAGSWAATHGRGAHGTFMSYGQQCEDTGISPWPQSCTLTGIFDPADGSFPVDATLEVPSDTTQVTDRPVVAPGRHPTDGTSVYVVGSRGWLEPAALELGALAALVAWAVLVRREWRGRRGKRSAASAGRVEDEGRHRRTDG